MKIIILDTNFLMHCIAYHIHIEEELRRICDFPFQVAIIDKTKKELEKINKPTAKVALLLCNRFVTLPTTSQGYVDDDILEFNTPNYLLATQDKELKKRWQQQKIVIRSKSHLEMSPEKILY